MSTLPPEAPSRLSLRELPLAARLVLSLFMISVGVGYLSALVQLHFQHAKPGSMLPTGKDAADVYHGPTGDRPRSKFEQLIEADENLPFNGQKQMSAAFTKKSVTKDGDSWSKHLKSLNRRGDAAAAEKALREERETERQAMLAWLRSGASKKDYDKDEFCLPEELRQKPLTEDYVLDKEKGTIKIRSLYTDRCIRCHKADGQDAEATKYPLDTWDRIKPHVTVQSSSGMSLTKLAQTTHVHLLGFSMLYGLTGLVLAFSTYPCWVRIILCPLPLLAQLIDIGCWWMARVDPMYAHWIVYTGGIVAVSLVLHIILSLLNMYSVTGKLVLLVMLMGAGGGGFILKTQMIDPYLKKEKEAAASAAEQ